MDKVFVTKRSGEQEEFSDEKVLRSMERVGLPQDYRAQVLDDIKKNLHPNITTQEVFSHISNFLQSSHEKASLRYNLKQAMFELGPTGFPFERYMERVFQSQGYETRVDVEMRGQCVMHEIDVVVDKGGKREIVEVKFHNQQGIKTDVQVAMYTYARFLDVEKNNDVSGVWLVTNTKLSEDAIIYAQCKGVKTIAWNYPGDDNLQDFVEKPELYPITILNGLSFEDKQRLLEQNIILCHDLVEKNISAHDILIPDKRLEKAKAEAVLISAQRSH